MRRDDAPSARKYAQYQRVARLYDILDLPFEYRRYQPMRQEIWSGLEGRLLDAGVGTGRNMAFYPPESEMVGLDLSPAMLRRAGARQWRLGAAVELVEGDIMATGFPDATFDAVVATFLFCVLEPEQQLPALREIRRICKPDGEIRILEYAVSTDPCRRAVMRLWTPWVRLLYGAAFDRKTEQYLDAARLDLIERRFLFKDIVKLLVARPRPENAAAPD